MYNEVTTSVLGNNENTRSTTIGKCDEDAHTYVLTWRDKIRNEHITGTTRVGASLLEKYRKKRL